MKLTHKELSQIVDFARNANSDERFEVCTKLMEYYPRVFLNILNKNQHLNREYYVIDSLGQGYKLSAENINGVIETLKEPSSCPKITAIKYLRDSAGFPKTETNSISLRSAKTAVEEIMADNKIH